MIYLTGWQRNNMPKVPT